MTFRIFFVAWALFVVGCDGDYVKACKARGGTLVKGFGSPVCVKEFR